MSVGLSDMKLKRKLILNSELIICLLEQRGKTQTWLADIIGVSRQVVSRALLQNSVIYAERFGNALGLDPKDLLLTVEDSDA